MQFMKVVTFLNQALVRAGALLSFAWQLAATPRRSWGLRSQLESQIPLVPKIDTATRVLLLSIALVKNDAGIAPYRAIKFVI